MESSLCVLSIVHSLNARRYPAEKLLRLMDSLSLKVLEHVLLHVLAFKGLQAARNLRLRPQPHEGFIDDSFVYSRLNELSPGEALGRFLVHIFKD